MEAACKCNGLRRSVLMRESTWLVAGLFEKYPSVAALAGADVDDIEKIVHPCGLGKSKAKDISACMKMLHEQFNDRVPDDFVYF